jgi:TipAS antibiotic-recognition domain
MNPKTFTAEYLQACRVALSTEQAASLAATDNWSHVDKAKVHQDWDALYQELTPLMQHLSPDAPEIQAIMAKASLHWHESALAYTMSFDITT